MRTSYQDYSIVILWIGSVRN